MNREVLLYFGSALITLWGVAHIIPTKPVVDGFGPISVENRRIITMEWISEGITLCFLGFLIFAIVVFEGLENPASVIVSRSVAGMLIVMAGVTLFTGARTSILPIKMCPVIKTVCAVLFLLGSI